MFHTMNVCVLFLQLLALASSKKFGRQNKRLRNSNNHNNGVELADDVIYIATTYYADQLKSTNDDEDNYQYFMIKECDESKAGNDQTQLSVIATDDINWDMSKSWIAAEVSKCKTKWDNDDNNCVFATNYVYDPNGINTVAQAQVVWNNSNLTLNDSTFYIRFKAQKSNSDFTFLLSYVRSMSVTNGKFNSDVFNQQVVTDTSVYQNALQYAKTSGEYSIPTGGHSMFFVYFCDQSSLNKNNDDLVDSTTTTVSVTVVSTVDAPLSAFDLYVCPASVAQATCNPNYDGNIARNIHATSVVSVTLNSNDHPGLDEGVWIYVEGYGGTNTTQNTFILSVTQSTA